MTSRPVGQEGHCIFSCWSSPWPRKEFDWNGDVATRVDCVPQRLNSLRNIYPKGWLILARSFVLEDEWFSPEGGWWRLMARNIVMTSRPVGQEGHCFLIVALSIIPRTKLVLFFICIRAWPSELVFSGIRGVSSHLVYSLWFDINKLAQYNQWGQKVR